VSGNLQLLTDTLARAKQENRAALITGSTAGFPTVSEGIAVIQAMLTSGADIVEVGLPHSDPVLDGPVVQAADHIALRGGVRIADVIRTVREAYQATGKPVLVMSYWNPIDKYGVERFSAELAAAGGAGCILPDLPVQESALWRESAARHALATVFVAAPSTTDERLRELAAAGTGFIYAASLMGVTGVRQAVSTVASPLVRRIKAITDLPVCVGIGISNASQAGQVAEFADGVIVASALVKAVLDAPDAALAAAAVAELTAELSLAARTRGIEASQLSAGEVESSPRGGVGSGQGCS
jgi:tryptophan synthase alpha chain